MPTDEPVFTNRPDSPGSSDCVMTLQTELNPHQAITISLEGEATSFHLELESSYNRDTPTSPETSSEWQHGPGHFTSCSQNLWWGSARHLWSLYEAF